MRLLILKYCSKILHTLCRSNKTCLHADLRPPICPSTGHWGSGKDFWGEDDLFRAVDQWDLGVKEEFSGTRVEVGLVAERFLPYTVQVRHVAALNETGGSGSTGEDKMLDTLQRPKGQKLAAGLALKGCGGGCREVRWSSPAGWWFHPMEVTVSSVGQRVLKHKPCEALLLPQ